MGIIKGHAYTFMFMIEFQKNGQKVRLLRVRNPWSNYEWKGNWSDNAPEWTPELS